MGETNLTRAFFDNRRELIAFLRSRLQCPATANDLCQDVFLKLQHVDDPRTIKNCRSYLFMIAANLASDYLRKETRRSAILEDRPELAPQQSPIQTPEEIYLARAEIDYLNRAISELPALTRKIFHANRFENKSQREIAAACGVSLSTVEYHIRKVLDRLAEARDEFHQQK